MKDVVWDFSKNEQLKVERGVSFDEVAVCIAQEKILDVMENPGQNRGSQKVYVIEIRNHIYYVPFVEDKEKIFLKTIIPSRKLKKKYMNDGGEL